MDAAYDIEQLKSFLYETIKKSNNRIWYSPNVIPQKLSDLARDSQLEELRRMTVVGYESGRTLSPYRHVHELRWRKSPAEVRLMRQAGEIASAAFIETMKFSRSGVDENFLLAKMDYECRTRGAQGLAYPPVIAGGDRANIIHYLNADQVLFVAVYLRKPVFQYCLKRYTKIDGYSLLAVAMMFDFRQRWTACFSI